LHLAAIAAIGIRRAAADAVQVDVGVNAEL
jgi:hypothetical protein